MKNITNQNMIKLQHNFLNINYPASFALVIDMMTVMMKKLYI
jgi:hypothetical protein